jgi:hypothetical protein
MFASLAEIWGVLAQIYQEGTYSPLINTQTVKLPWQMMNIIFHKERQPFMNLKT